MCLHKIICSHRILKSSMWCQSYFFLKLLFLGWSAKLSANVSKLDQIDSTGNITLIFKFKTLNRCKRLVDDAAAPTNFCLQGCYLSDNPIHDPNNRNMMEKSSSVTPDSRSDTYWLQLFVLAHLQHSSNSSMQVDVTIHTVFINGQTIHRRYPCVLIL